MPLSLRESLADWMDWDGAAFNLAVCVGLMNDATFQTRSKHVFWSQNETGELLFRMLDQLVAAGVLETRTEPDRQYRWNPAYCGIW
jgi:hypothetical protein